MPGVPDPLYVAARRVLLDALDALGPLRRALVLVGAQAVYCHAGEADLATAPYTTDGDIAVDPSLLDSNPRIEQALGGAGFVADPDLVGAWLTSIDVEGFPRTVEVDLLVPDSVAGAGRRAARIPPHGGRVARKAVGLEGALVDKDPHVLTAFEASDERRIEVDVAGPAGLIVAKVHKIYERESTASRLENKDALDIYRLLRAVETTELAVRFARLEKDPISSATTAVAIREFARLFGSVRAPGCSMAVDAAGPAEDGEILAASYAALAIDLLDEIG
jgi:hypothetical protein